MFKCRRMYARPESMLCASCVYRSVDINSTSLAQPYFQDTMGSFTCVCPVGFTLANDGSCLDVNECALGGHNCQTGETCLNLPGGVACFSKFNSKDSGHCVLSVKMFWDRCGHRVLMSA